MPHIVVEHLTVGPIGVNCYIVENTETKECFVVDPGAEADKILARIADRTPVAVLLTHGHFDHIGAVDALCAHFGIPVYIHKADAPKLTDGEANVSALFGAPLVQHTPPSFVDEGDVLTLAGIPLQVLHTPGHSAGSVCYLLPDGQGILTGDTLFAHGYGRTDFADGDFGVLYTSLRRLFRLSPKMNTYPGHDVFGVVGRNASEEEL